MAQRPNLMGRRFGKYQLLSLIGEGGFADVYLGVHLDLGTQAAIKVLHDADIDAFRTEARTIARLDHPHIIRVRDFDIENSIPFLVMDYAAGGTMRQRHRKGSIVSLPTIVSYVQQTAQALQYAHNANLIHRDIKPDNILLDQYNNILLSDFGIVTIAHSTRSMKTVDHAGTATYTSPEQIQGRPRFASDQYSLGIIVYEWLSGTPPFKGSFTEIWSQHMFTPTPSLREKISTITPEVEQVVMKALEKDPKQRFEHVSDFATALRQASLAGQADTIFSPLPIPIPPQPKSTIPPPSQPTVILSKQGINTTPPKPFSYKIPQVITKWTFKTSSPVTSSPTVVNGIVYFGSHDHNLYAVDAATGEQMWPFLTGKKVYSSPTVDNGIVYFGSQDCNLYALNASTGQKMWSFPAESAIDSSPTVANGIVYFGSHDHKLYAVDVASGLEKWVFSTSHFVASSPTIDKGMVYFGSNDSKLYALNAVSGQKMWSFYTGKEVHSSPTVADGMVYFGSRDRKLYAVDATSGQEKWSFPTDDAVLSSPAVDNGIVYFGSDDGYLYAVDAASGQEVWSFPTDFSVFSSPTVFKGIICFGSSDNKLYALDATSGQEMWSFPTGGAVFSSPTVDENGIIYFGSQDGKLYAVSA